MDVDYGSSFDNAELEKLWELFGDIAVDDNDTIQEKFLNFQEGTNGTEIWQWFDERYSRSVVTMLYPEGL